MGSPGIYPPAHHAEHDTALLVRCIEILQLATLVAVRDDDADVAFVPMLVQHDDHGVTLFGHIDAANPQAAQLDGKRMHAIFHGPHGYISPDDYRSAQLPTWNYAHVVAAGTVHELRGDDEKRDLLIRMAECFGGAGQDFVLDAKDRRMAGMLGGICAFRIEVDRLIGRLKLSQDKSAPDAAAALVAMQRKSAERERALVSLIQEEGLLP